MRRPSPDEKKPVKAASGWNGGTVWETAPGLLRTIAALTGLPHCTPIPLDVFILQPEPLPLQAYGVGDCFSASFSSLSCCTDRLMPADVFVAFSMAVVPDMFAYADAVPVAVWL